MSNETKHDREAIADYLETMARKLRGCGVTVKSLSLSSGHIEKATDAGWAKCEPDGTHSMTIRWKDNDQAKIPV